MPNNGPGSGEQFDAALPARVASYAPEPAIRERQLRSTCSIWMSVACEKIELLLRAAQPDFEYEATFTMRNGQGEKMIDVVFGNSGELAKIKYEKRECGVPRNKS